MQRQSIFAATKTLLRQPGFLIVAGVLLISAISLNAATEYLQLYFKKLPVEMSADFTTIPHKLGHWVEISKDEKLPQDEEHVLGATHYLYRDYVDDRLVPQNVIDQFQGKTFAERKQMMLAIQQKLPQAVLNVGITYYTGAVDTVAHMPDRCYIADGYEPTSHNTVRWSAFEGRPGRAPEKDGDICYINFEDQVATRQSTQRNVAYFFQANGSYTADPIGVRVSCCRISASRYAYYSKIELMTQMSDSKQSADLMNDYLTQALPEIERCLPDWSKVTAPANKK